MPDLTSLNKTGDWLLVSSIIYLSLPLILFIIGWFSWYWAVPLLIISIYLLVPTNPVSTASSNTFIPLKELLGLTLLAVFWTYSAGLGEHVAQSVDYFKHNLIHHDLIVKSWPVVYPATPEEPASILCYPLAYYLPVAIASKLTGIGWAAFLQFTWGGLGVGIVFLWIHRICRPYGLLVVIGFTLFDTLGWLVLLPSIIYKAAIYVVDGTSLSFNSEYVLYIDGIRVYFSNPISTLVWQPQHSLGTWIATGIMLDSLVHRALFKSVYILAPALLLWSPLAWLGWLPFAVLAWWQNPEKKRIDLIVGCLLLIIPLGLYFLSHLPLQVQGFLWTHVNLGNAGKLLIFLFLNIGVYAALLGLFTRRLNVPKVWFQVGWLAILVLLGSMVYYASLLNDAMLQVSRAPWMVLSIMFVYFVCVSLKQSVNLGLKLSAGLVLILGVVKPVATYVLLPQSAYFRNPCTSTIRTATVAGADMQRYFLHDKSIRDQYLGRTNHVFGEILMKK